MTPDRESCRGVMPAPIPDQKIQEFAFMKSARISPVRGLCLRLIAVLARSSMSLCVKKTARTASEARPDLPALSLRFPISQEHVRPSSRSLLFGSRMKHSLILSQHSA
jgi:hypothetical protein